MVGRAKKKVAAKTARAPKKTAAKKAPRARKAIAPIVVAPAPAPGPSTFRMLASRMYAAIAAVLPFASDDATRPHINTLHLDCTSGSAINIVATNGHVLALWSGAPEADSVPAKESLTLATAAKFLRALKPWRTSEASASIVVEGTRAILRIAGVDTEIGPASEESFPPYLKVLPHYQGHGQHTPALNAEYVQRAGKSFSVAAPTGIAPIHIYGGKDWGDPGVVVSPDVPELIVVVMPIRTDRSALPWIQKQ